MSPLLIIVAAFVAMTAPPDTVTHDDQPSGADADLAEALHHLPPKQRQAVAYHYLGGLPYADVADLIGGTATAARRAAADGIATLRRTYAGVDTTKGTQR